MNKVIVITGTSSGVGVALALQAAKAGHTVYATMRNLEKRDVLDKAVIEAGVSLNVVQLDVQDTNSVNSAIQTVFAEQGRIDCLIANAGAGYVRTTEQATEEDINWITDVNYMGVVRCTKAVLPHMRKAKEGRVIAISSVGGLVGQPFNEFYCAAKFAVEGYIESLASYIGPEFGIKFSLVEPGGISSEFANNVLAQLEKSGGMFEDEYLPVLQRYIGGRSTRNDGVFQTSDEVASVIMDCVSSENPPLRTRTSPWSEEFTKLKTSADPDGSKLAKLVYEQMLGK